MARKSPSRRDERKQHLRGEILRVANVLFAQHGYENVTLRKIAEEIGYSHATIYQHFADKSEIFYAVFEGAFHSLEKEFDELASAPLEPVDRLFATSRGLIRFCISHPEHMRAAFLGPEDMLGAKVGKQIADTGRPLFGKFLKVFQEAVKSSGFKLKRLNDTAVTWGHSVFGLAIVLSVQGNLPNGYLSAVPPNYTIDQALRWMWAGIASEPSSYARPRRKPTTAG